MTQRTCVWSTEMYIKSERKWNIISNLIFYKKKNEKNGEVVKNGWGDR